MELAEDLEVGVLDTKQRKLDKTLSRLYREVTGKQKAVVIRRKMRKT